MVSVTLRVINVKNMKHKKAHFSVNGIICYDLEYVKLCVTSHLLPVSVERGKAETLVLVLAKELAVAQVDAVDLIA